ncbi:hypothetical protein ACEWY4_000242 [Coilia grayii]|uniref:Ig-like domain-containing protein n=1 Tax=Coilia grayii TaxID=363190 RepID=A0ABD1KW31_9TELE
MKGHTPFHEFSALLMLDDIQIAYYSSTDQTLYPRGPMNDSIFDQSDQKYTVYLLSIMHEHVRVSAGFHIQQCNITHDLPTHQSISGCDADLDYSEPVRMIYKEAFEGDGGSELYFSPEKTLETHLRDPGDWDGYINHWTLLINDIFEPICRHAIKRFLRINRKHVMRKVKPRVRLLQKALPDNGDVKVTCLATGFYPRHINLTLLRDGQPVPDHQITWGELLPNGDGTYQMRKSLEVSTEEVQHHQYTCTAQHLSLDNKLDISLGDYDDGDGDNLKREVMLPPYILAAVSLCRLPSINELSSSLVPVNLVPVNWLC